MQVLSLNPVTPSARHTRHGKVTQSDFTPRTAKLANAAKIQARTCTATQNAFPAEASAAAFVNISHAVEKASGPDAITFRDAFDWLQINLTAQEDIFTYLTLTHSLASLGWNPRPSTSTTPMLGYRTEMPVRSSEAIGRAFLLFNHHYVALPAPLLPLPSPYNPSPLIYSPPLL